MRRVAPLLAFLALLVILPATAQESGVSGELEQAATTSPREKSEFADGAIAEIQGAVRTVQALKTEAEREKKTEVVECLMRKLTPMLALQEVSELSANAMKQALSVSDAHHAEQEYRKVAVALTKTREFLAEAQACAGDGSAEAGETSSAMNDGGANDVDPADVPNLDIDLEIPDTPR